MDGVGGVVGLGGGVDSLSPVRWGLGFLFFHAGQECNHA